MKRLWSFAIACAVGCSSSSSSGPSGPGSTQTSESCAQHQADEVEGVCAAWADAYCAHTTRCAPAAANWASQESCVEAQSAKCKALVALSGVSNAVGKYWSWAQALARPGCYDPTPQTDPTCASAGTLPAGSKCVSSTQCEDGAYCKITVSGVSCGLCVTRVGEGEACAASDDCRDGLWCQDKTCQPISAPGEPCSSKYQCGREGLCTSGVCEIDNNHRLKLGEACRYFTDCMPGLACEASVCVEAKLGAEGESCSTFRPCAYGLFCNDKARCEVYVPGKPCGSLIFGCRLGQYCKDRGVCTDKIPVGGACAAADFNTDCVEGATCFRGVCGFVDDSVCR